MHPDEVADSLKWKLMNSILDLIQPYVTLPESGMFLNAMVSEKSLLELGPRRAWLSFLGGVDADELDLAPGTDPKPSKPEE